MTPYPSSLTSRYRAGYRDSAWTIALAAVLANLVWGAELPDTPSELLTLSFDTSRVEALPWLPVGVAVTITNQSDSVVTFGNPFGVPLYLTATFTDEEAPGGLRLRDFGTPTNARPGEAPPIELRPGERISGLLELPNPHPKGWPPGEYRLTALYRPTLDPDFRVDGQPWSTTAAPPVESEQPLTLLVDAPNAMLEAATLWHDAGLDLHGVEPQGVLHPVRIAVRLVAQATFEEQQLWYALPEEAQSRLARLVARSALPEAAPPAPEQRPLEDVARQAVSRGLTALLAKPLQVSSSVVLTRPPNPKVQAVRANPAFWRISPTRRERSLLSLLYEEDLRPSPDLVWLFHPRTPYGRAAKLHAVSYLMQSAGQREQALEELRQLAADPALVEPLEVERVAWMLSLLGEPEEGMALLERTPLTRWPVRQALVARSAEPRPRSLPQPLSLPGGDR